MKKLITLIILLTCNQVMAKDKIVQCEITSGDESDYKGECLFSSEKGGSFSLMSINKNKPLYEDIDGVSVDIIEEGLAEVRGLTTAGLNSRWGEAKRSTKDKACWEGSDFKICAW